MNNTYIPFEELKLMYPNEWLLLGNPKIDDTAILGGILVYHSKDKKEVCYLGRDKAIDYSTVTIAFAGNSNPNRKIGILKKI